MSNITAMHCRGEKSKNILDLLPAQTNNIFKSFVKKIIMFSQSSALCFVWWDKSLIPAKGWAVHQES